MQTQKKDVELTTIAGTRPEIIELADLVLLLNFINGLYSLFFYITGII